MAGLAIEMLPVAPSGGKPAFRISTLTKRADFLRASRARRQGAGSVHLQARQRTEGEANLLRVGFTCSKKVGNAVARNRAKRRLRAAARIVLPLLGQSGWDYVLIGRRDSTATVPFDQLLSDLRQTMRRIHQ